MLNEETYRQLMDMKLYSIAEKFKEYLDQVERDELTFEERMGIMVDLEWTERQERRLKYRLKRSKLRETACIEDINYRHPRGLDRSVMQRLVTCKWVKSHENIIFTGKTGLGKTWLACALAHKACREGHTTLYVRVPRILQDLYVAHADGSYPKVMDRLSKPEILILDDFGLSAAVQWQAGDFSERTGISCDITSQPPEIVVDPHLSTTVFRIFQETLTNITRHAQATEVHATVKLADGVLEMSVCDNGKGLCAEASPKRKSFGLLGISERVRERNGDFVIRDASNGGTCVEIRIPLAMHKDVERSAS